MIMMDMDMTLAVDNELAMIAGSIGAHRDQDDGSFYQRKTCELLRLVAYILENEAALPKIQEDAGRYRLLVETQMLAMETR